MRIREYLIPLEEKIALDDPVVLHERTLLIVSRGGGGEEVHNSLASEKTKKRPSTQAPTAVMLIVCT